MGYELVRILLIGVGSGKPVLQIMAENAEGMMGVEDCSRLSQAASAILDVENFMDGAYFLEVSSPGIDRPLTRLKDFERFSGNEAKIEIDEAINGQKKFKGRLKGVRGQDVVFENESGGDVIIPFPTILKAKLMLTDDLIKSAQQKKAN